MKKLHIYNNITFILRRHSSRWTSGGDTWSKLLVVIHREPTFFGGSFILGDLEVVTGRVEMVTGTTGPSLRANDYVHKL